MRRSTLLFLCSTVAPGGAALVGCNFSSPDQPTPEAGFPGLDATATFESGTETGTPESGLDAGDGGDASPSGTLATTPIDFGLVDCGGSPPAARTYSFQNTGPLPIVYSAAVGTGSIFSIQGASAGTVAPGATGSLTIAASSVPGTSTAGTKLTGTLTVTTNVPGYTTVTVPLTMTPHGGSLTLSPALAGFGQDQLTVQAADIPLTLTNTGNAPVTLTIDPPTDPEFAVVYAGAPSAATLAPGASLAQAAARFKATSVGAKTATAALKMTSPMCASPVMSIAMSGTGTTAAVTVGPSPVDFKTVLCGQKASAAPVTIVNGYAFPVTYTAALGLGAGSPYTLDVPGGTVPANGQAVVNVTPLPIPVPGSVAANAYGDTLTVTTSAPSVPPATVTLLESASGAILAVAMNTTGFGPVGVNTTASLPFTVTNSGNLDAPLSLGVAGDSFAGAFIGSSTATASGGTAGGDVTFTPSAIAAYTGSMLVSTTQTLCAAAPTSIGVSGQGDGSVASYATTPLSFAVTCGGAASANQTLTITNTGNASLSLSNVTTTAHFTVVSYTSTPIAPNASGSIVVQASSPVIGTDQAGTFAETLGFTTNEPGSPTHTVPLSVAISGANLSYVDAKGSPITQVAFNLCPTSATVGVKNTGDLAATVQGPSPMQTPHAGFDGTFSNGMSVAPGQTVFGSVRAISQDNVCGGTDDFSFSVIAGTVCMPPPAFPVVYNYAPANCNKGPCC